MTVLTFISSCIGYTRNCTPRRLTEGLGNSEIIISPKSCSVETSNALYIMSIIGIFEMLFISIPIYLTILAFLYFRTGISNTNVSKYLTYITIFMMLVSFVISIFTDFYTIYVYDHQIDTDSSIVDKMYIIYFCILCFYYTIIVSYIIYINRDRISYLVNKIKKYTVKSL